ncbi:MAG: hypothetical protein M1819_000218 [Sarea resinae]|nr:MAG: hypothetical protein M1819_000218 [Sarea resinae]
MIRSSVRACLRNGGLSYSNRSGSAANVVLRAALQHTIPWRRHAFHSAAGLRVLKPFYLADIGEGIRECEVIQWFVEPEARVEQFDKLCEVQSDKASVEITSRFDGVIKKLHYEAGETAIVGKPLVDIDVLSEASPEDEAVTPPPQPSTSATEESQAKGDAAINVAAESTPVPPSPPGKFATLATPAVRHLLKELKVNITDLHGTGRDGRVLKEDVHRYAASRESSPKENVGNASPTAPGFESPNPEATPNRAATSSPSTTQPDDIPTPLTAIQRQMFKTMTRSLQIPHFLYTDAIDMGPLTSLRRSLNSHNPSSPNTKTPKLTALPFILKAVSVALNDYPVLNARLSIPATPPSHPPTDPAIKPTLLHRPSHNLGIAMDTPSGLLVPTIKSVNTKSILEITSELQALSARAGAGALTPADLAAGSFTVSNIGSIGGRAVSPVIVDSELAILGVGRAALVPAFDERGLVVAREECVFSLAADHRVVDGATVARFVERVRALLERPAAMMVLLS